MDEKFEFLKKKFRLKAERDLLKERLQRKLEAETARPPLVMPAEWTCHSEFLFSRRRRESFALDPGLLASPVLNPGGFPPEELLFFDLETTGLSGGAGNVAFLVGLGRLTAGELEIEQFFLADFPGEPELLGLLAGKLTPDRLYVSYNGKSFDTHVLQARFLLAGRQIAFPHQLDLLYLCRRLWKKSLANCSLGEIETRVLGVERRGDVPGHQVPELYFDFLKSGRLAGMEKVFYHNYVDILSLARLLAHLLQVFAGRVEDSRIDGCGLGSYLLKRDGPRGAAVLAAAFAAGDRAAGLDLALYHKRAGRWPEALALWEELCRRGPCLEAARELAMYYEHRAGDYAAALSWIERMAAALSGDPEKWADWEKRRARCERKQAGRLAGRDDSG